MRAAVLLVALAGCAHPHPTPRPGRDATIDGARPLPYEGDRAGHAVSGVVTARGGDPIDWYVFEVQRACTSVEVALRWKGGRGPTQLQVDVVDPLGARQSKLLARRGVVRVDNAAIGHYHVRVAVEGDAAAHYVMAVRDASSGFECGDAPPPTALEVKRAPSATLPPAAPGTVAAPIVAWETWRGYDDKPRILARLGAGYDDGVDLGDRGPAVDDHGRTVTGVELTIISREPHTALAEMDGPVPDSAGIIVGAFIRRPPLPTPPLTIRVLDRWRDREGVMVELDAGELEGVGSGWQGPLRASDGRELAGIAVLRVEPHRSVARIAGKMLDDILPAQQAVIGPPPPSP